MATLEIKEWTNPDGIRHTAESYTVRFCHDQRRYKLPGFAINADGKDQSEELARNAKRLLDAQAGGTMPPNLRRYVEGLPARTRRSMARQGIIDPGAEGKSIAAHIADFKAALLAKGNTRDTADATAAMLLEAVEKCHFKKLGDVTAGKLRARLADRRQATPVLDEKGDPRVGDDKKPIMRPGLSPRRYNAIRQAWGHFFRWCIKERRAYENPVVNLATLNERTDKRHQRRALEPAEVRKLLDAATKGGELAGMAGTERALVYRVALESGLRLNELATMTRACVDLARGTLTVRAAYSKHRREDVLPMRPELAKALAEHLTNKAPAARVFNIPDRFTMLRAFRADCTAAGIKAQDADSRWVDFHGLRHTFISSLAAGGVHPKTAQTLARHSTISLTMDRYTHTLRGDEAAALSVLPDYSTPAQAQEAKATGTDGKVCENTAQAPAMAPRASNAAGGASGAVVQLTLTGAETASAQLAAAIDAQGGAVEGEILGHKLGHILRQSASQDGTTRHTSTNEQSPDESAKTPIDMRENRMPIDCPGRDSNPHPAFARQNFKS